MWPSSGRARTLSRETILLAAVATLAGAIRGFTGFGAGLFMAPILGLLFGPARAVPILILLDAAVSAILLPGSLRTIRVEQVGRLALPAVACLPIGSLILGTLDPVTLRKGTGLIVLATVAALVAGWRVRREPGAVATAAVGAASGLLTGAAGIGGPPVALFHLSRTRESGEVRSELIAFFGVTQAAALIYMGFRALIQHEDLVRSAMMAPCFLAAAWAGGRSFGARGGHGYRAAAYLLLAASGLVGLLAW